MVIVSEVDPLVITSALAPFFAELEKGLIMHIDGVGEALIIGGWHSMAEDMPQVCVFCVVHC